MRDGRDAVSGAGASRITGILGAWLALSPFILGYARLAPALWTSLLVGVLIALLSAAGPGCRVPWASAWNLSLGL